MTVAELIQKLSTMDPTLNVVMSMNNEYECDVEEGMVIRSYDAHTGVEVVRIDDNGDYAW